MEINLKSSCLNQQRMYLLKSTLRSISSKVAKLSEQGRIFLKNSSARRVEITTYKAFSFK